MTVLRRDAELKRSEEERIRKLEQVLHNDGQEPEHNLKYFTGEWFYEAKSRRHMDKIHGSEIILASMKRRKSALDGSLRIEWSKSPSSQGSDLVPPPKPARTWDALQPTENINPEEKDVLQVRSPRTPRHNPFNRVSLLVTDSPENVEVSPSVAEQQRSVDPESGQMSAGSVTFDASSAGFRPVPKKRTFISRRSSSTQGPETLGPQAVIVPAPRRRLQHGSSGSSGQSNVKPQDSRGTNPDTVTPTQQVLAASQVCSSYSLDGDAPGIQKNSTRSYITGDGEATERQDNLLQTQPVDTESVRPHDGNSIPHSQGENISSEESSRRQVFSFTRTSLAAEPPVSYDLNFIDKSDQQVQSTVKHELKLSTQSASPTGDEDDSITKVLDWFGRSVNSSDWLTNQKVPNASQEIRNDPSCKDDLNSVPKVKLETQPHKDLMKDCQEKALSQEQSNEENQQGNISNLKSFWEKSKTGPKILISKSSTANNKTSKTNKDEDEDILSTTRYHNGLGISNHKEDSDTPFYKSADESSVFTGANSPRQKVTGAESQTNGDSTLSEEKNRMPYSQIQAKDHLESTEFLKPSVQISPKVQLRSSNEDVDKRNSGERSPKISMSPKRREEGSIKEAAIKDKERIKHLKSFWEQERSKTGYYAGKPKAGSKGMSGKLNKRHAKSEFDLQLIGKASDSEDDNKLHQHFIGLQLNQKAEKSSPNLGRRQFNTLLDFWDEATSDSKSFASDKTRSPKRTALQSQEVICDEQVNYKKPGPAAAQLKSSPPYKLKSPMDKQAGSKADSKTNYFNNYTSADSAYQRDVRRSPKDSCKSPKNKKDSFSTSSSRINSFRRAQSMFSLSTDETDRIQIDVSPVHSQSRKPRANTAQGAGPRRHSEETEALTPRARAFVPTDYRHYLGMTDKNSIHSAPVTPSHDKGSKEVKADHDSRRGCKTHQRPLSPNYSSSDTCPEFVSNASESRSSSRLSSNRESETDSPVRRALRRAEARPKNLTKSLEDITVASSPRTERRQELSVDQRSSSDGSSLPSPMSSLFSDREHIKKMSKSVPSFLQKEMSGSVMTMYSGDFGCVDVQGTIHFSIHYVQKLREFHIFVAQCKDLAPVDPKRGRSDPYVKSYLVPDKAHLGKRKTSVKKKALNPVFNEILRYRVRMEYLRTQTLILSVWHHDTFGKNSFLGEIDVDLSKWDFDHTQMNYLALKARTYPTLAPPNCRGEMRLAIRYVPQINHSDGLAKVDPNTGEIHIWVKECKNLPMVRATIDPYVKCFMLPDTSKKSRQKTRVLRGTADPVFNHTMVYDGIREADLMEACVELTVLDRDRLASNFLGGLRIGAGTGRSYGSLVDWMDSTAYEVALWDRMMASPNEWVEDVLPIRWLHSTKATSK